MLDESGGEQTINIKRVVLTQPEKKAESAFYPLTDFTEADWKRALDEWQRDRTNYNGTIMLAWMKLVAPDRVEKLGLLETDTAELADQTRDEARVLPTNVSKFVLLAGLLRVIDPEARRKYPECYDDSAFNTIKDYISTLIENDTPMVALRVFFKAILAFPNGNFLPPGFITEIKNEVIESLSFDWQNGNFQDLVEILSAIRLAEPELFNELKIQYPLDTPIHDGFAFHRDQGTPSSLIEFAAKAMVTQAKDIRKTEKGVTLILPEQTRTEATMSSMPVLKLI